MAGKNGYRDSKAPDSLQVVVFDNEGREWGRVYAMPKQFSTGSMGYYVSGKLINPLNLEARYQCGLTFTLVGSKPEGK
jgi:hypothetical protein